MDLERKTGDPERICIEVYDANWSDIRNKKTAFVEYSFRIKTNFSLESDSGERFLTRGDALEGAYKYLRKYLGLRWFDPPVQSFPGKWWKRLR